MSIYCTRGVHLRRHRLLRETFDNYIHSSNITLAALILEITRRIYAYMDKLHVDSKLRVGWLSPRNASLEAINYIIVP